jgi:hypothetical protein
LRKILKLGIKADIILLKLYAEKYLEAVDPRNQRSVYRYPIQAEIPGVYL